MANAFGAGESITGIEVDGQPTVPPPPVPAGPDSTGVSALSDIERQSSALSGRLSGFAHEKEQDEANLDRHYSTIFSQDRERLDRAIKAESAGPDSLPPKWDAAAEKAKNSTGPMEAFGSVGMIFALAASAFTKAPMTSALKAGGAVLEAIHAGDEDRYKSAYAAWKDNADLAIKQFDMEHTLVSDADKLASTDMAQWREQRLMLAAKFDDKKAIAMIEAGLDPDVLKTTEAAVSAKEKMVEAKDKMETVDAEMSIIRAEKKSFMEKNGITDPNDLRVLHYTLGVKQSLKDPANSEQTLIMKNWRNEMIQNEHRMPTGEEENKKWQEIQAYGARAAASTSSTAEVMRRAQTYENDPKSPTYKNHAASYDRAAKEVKEANASPLTGNRKEQLEAHVDHYGQSLQTIDKVLNVLENHKGAAGIAGKAMRLTERIGNIAGLNETDRVQMMRDIEQLQLVAPELLLDRVTGRPLSSEAGKTNDIIAGLQAGDTGPNTIRALKELKRRYASGREEAVRRLEGEWSAPAPGDKPPAGGGKSPSQDPPWKLAPIKVPADQRTSP